uniref:KIF27 protein n=1 Tax=Malurus cyaneus samueli TaxID=2593467 RepID=A0A8C5UEC7_9PASS
MVQKVRKEAPTTQETDTGTETTPEPHHFTILQLKRELKKCQQVLIMDEELFSQKNHEMQILQNQIKALLQEKEEQLEFLKEAQETQRLQTEKMVEQQMLIDQLKLKLEKFTDVKDLDFPSAFEDRPAVVAFARRPYSVPLTKNLLHPLRLPSGTETQKVRYTSPTVFSLAQIMAEFRVRRQVILSKIEDQDKVLHCHLSDQSDEEEDNTGNEEKTSYKFYNSLLLCFFFQGEEVDSLQKIHIINMQKLKNSELKLAEAEHKIRELALNIKRKEELIKELVRTGKDAQSVSRQYSLKITKLEQEIEQAKRELAETQKQLQELDSKEMRETEKVMLQKECQKKMEAAKLKVQTLQKKQQDTKNLALLSNQSEREARELEQKVAQMKHQQSQIQKRLKKNNSAGTPQKLQVSKSILNLFEP